MFGWLESGGAETVLGVVFAVAIRRFGAAGLALSRVSCRFPPAARLRRARQLSDHCRTLPDHFPSGSVRQDSCRDGRGSVRQGPRGTLSNVKRSRDRRVAAASAAPAPIAASPLRPPCVAAAPCRPPQASKSCRCCSRQIHPRCRRQISALVLVVRPLQPPPLRIALRTSASCVSDSRCCCWRIPTR